jgi:transposase
MRKFESFRFLELGDLRYHEAQELVASIAPHLPPSVLEACKTDKVDARVLAELCRRDLVPELWVPSPGDRELRERLRRRMHLVRMRASAMNRIFGLLTQSGLRLSLRRLREPDAMALLEQHGVPEVWRRSIAEALDVIDLLDARIGPLDHELGPLARADARVVLLDTIPGVGDLLGLTLASEIGDVARFSSARKLIGYASLARRSTSPAPGRVPVRSRRPDRGPCGGPPSRPPNTPGARPTHGTSFTPSWPRAPTRTPPSPPSRARS